MLFVLLQVTAQRTDICPSDELSPPARQGKSNTHSHPAELLCNQHLVLRGKHAFLSYLQVVLEEDENTLEELELSMVWP